MVFGLIAAGAAAAGALGLASRHRKDSACDKKGERDYEEERVVEYHSEHGHYNYNYNCNYYPPPMQYSYYGYSYAYPR
ncbi:unnamed protein product [Rotaria sp. Silwood2]|nr:unnamed protein product [Rotaria sp. Silwood2]CAF2504184.1 unnamed protein product [Rotaria sp. Silwood2]CAF2734760.1 unnamed protein product [Rotaria sp. Silwood2]CAF2902185.1 unnamed protein product [Rotaria sp. Silwood2]CAF4053082.1 unnamed protein product [Rotaria sp. Silwood2]